MPRSHDQQAASGRRPKAVAPNAEGLDRSIWLLAALAGVFLPCFFWQPDLAHGDSTRPKAERQYDPNAYDIAIIIDNRNTATSASAKEDVKAITHMLDRHMLADHVIRLVRPSFAVVCDIFGGCPNEARHAWPSLITQIAERGKSRLYVYYLGPARLEGLERQLLFDGGSYALGWLHHRLNRTKPRSALVIADASFAPKPLPCASDNPHLINETMLTVQRTYARLLRGRSLPDPLNEFIAAHPAQANHCDRYTMLAEDIERPLFTKFVLKGVVEGQADKDPFGNGNGKIELGELQRYVDAEIRRTVRFQWGRRQSVWTVGTDSRAIALVEPRPGSQPETSSPVREEDTAIQENESLPTEPADDPTTAHVCDVNPSSEACLLYCARNAIDPRCPLSVCVGASISNDCPCVENDPRRGCANTGSWCSWSANELGSAANAIVDMTGGSPSDVCQWTTTPESAPISSFFDALTEALTPIGWRLARPFIQQTTACALNCQGRASPLVASLAFNTPATIPARLDDRLGRHQPTIAASSGVSAAPRPKTAFQQQICNDDLPPYITLPRWMPETLMISEALRLYAGCEPPSPRPRFAHGLPPPVTLVNAPPLPKPRYRPPPPFGMPPPVTLPPASLAPVPPPMFKPSVSEIRWLQSALLLDGHNPGPIDGVMGDKTRAALRSWREANSIMPVNGHLTEAEFSAIVRDFGVKFDQLIPNATLY